MDAAACIGCGACVAACPNGSAMLFVAAKLAHLHHLPQGQPERMRRTLAMVTAMDAAGLRQLLEPLRVRGRVPEGHLARCDGAPQPRLREGALLAHREDKSDGAG